MLHYIQITCPMCDKIDKGYADHIYNKHHNYTQINIGNFYIGVKTVSFVL